MEANHKFNYAMKPDWAGMWEKGIKEAWADNMVIKHGSINGAWDHSAGGYDADLEYSNRRDLVGKITVSQPETILDIGAGAGVFAIPLARVSKKIFAIEPSKEMLNILQKKAKKEGLANIISLRKKWEDASSAELMKQNHGKFDVVLSSHSLYYITDLHRSFQKMNDICKGYVYLFTGCSGYTRDSAYEKLYLALHKKPLPPYPDYSSLYMVLREIGIQPDVEMIEAKVKKPVKSVEEVVDKWREYLNVKELSGDQKDAVREYLAGKIKEENGELCHTYQYKNALIYWKVEQDAGGAAT
mgnify:CR=1 FL=1